MKEEIEFNNKNVGIVKSEFKSDQLVKTLQFHGLDDSVITPVMLELGDIIDNDNCVVAFTPIVKYDGNPHMINDSYDIDEVKTHIGKDSIVIIYSAKKEDDKFLYTCKLL